MTSAYLGSHSRINSATLILRRPRTSPSCTATDLCFKRESQSPTAFACCSVANASSSVELSQFDCCLSISNAIVSKATADNDDRLALPPPDLFVAVPALLETSLPMSLACHAFRGGPDVAAAAVAAVCEF